MVGESYAAVLRGDGVVRLVIATSISRMTTSMLSLSLLIAVSKSTGSVVDAGAVLFAHAVALALVAPAAGRLVDRFGSRRTLCVFVGFHTLSYVAVVFALVHQLPAAYLLLAAAALGATTPPSGSVVRASWPHLVPESNLSSAYALDTVINSSTFILGPILVGALLYVMPPNMIVGSCAVAKVVGDMLIANSPMARKATERRPRRLFSVLANAPLALLLAIVALDTFTIGAMQIGAVASVTATLAGVLLGGFAAGEVFGGIFYGALRAQPSVKRGMIAFHLVTACFFILMSMTSNHWLLLLLYLGAGVFSGARDALGQLAVGLSARPEDRTEAFGWLTSFMWAGYGLGTLLSGSLGEGWGASAIYLAAAAVSTTAVIATCWLKIVNPQPKE